MHSSCIFTLPNSEKLEKLFTGKEMTQYVSKYFKKNLSWLFKSCWEWCPFTQQVWRCQHKCKSMVPAFLLIFGFLLGFAVLVMPFVPTYTLWCYQLCAGLFTCLWPFFSLSWCPLWLLVSLMPSQFCHLYKSSLW